MLTNHFTLSWLAECLHARLAGSTITESFTQEPDELVLRFSGRADALIISCDRNFNTLYLRPSFVRARTNSVDVLNGCLQHSIASISIHPADRVVFFKMLSGIRIDARFFAAKANVVLVDKSEVIIDAFKHCKESLGTQPTYRHDEVVPDADRIANVISDPNARSAYSALKDVYPMLGTTLATEVLHRAGIPTGAKLREADGQALQRGFLSVQGDLRSPLARVYVDQHETPKAFSIIPLLHNSALTERKFDDVHEAIRYFTSNTRRREFVEDEKRVIIEQLRRRLSKAQRTIDAVERDLNDNSRPEMCQQFGESLKSSLHLLKRGDEQFVTDDARIPLQKNLSPIQNAQRYFEKAKQSRIAQREANKRLTELHASVSPLKKLLSLADKVNSKEELKRFMTAHEDELEELGVGKKGEAREQLPFRTFTVDGGFEVWAGKSSKNNDELTLKHAKPNDLWFHARGASGSHVILKITSGKGEPSKKAKEQAASIAAYYSKMRNAKMVPVTMTEKKHVRKPKGAAPGSVTLEREKVIFAEPALPLEQDKRKE